MCRAAGLLHVVQLVCKQTPHYSLQMGKIVILRQHPNPFHCRFIYSHSLFNHEVTLTCLCNLDISIFFLLTWYQQHLVSRSKGAALILLPTPNSSRICQIETLHLACITLKNPCMPRCSWVTRLPSSSKQGVSLSVWVGWPSAAHLLRPIKNSLVSCVFGLGINRQFPQGRELLQS